MKPVKPLHNFMASRLHYDRRGFTLPELLVATALSLVALASIGSLFRAQTHTVKGQESRMEAHEYALTVADMLVREIRNTGYFPVTACDATGGITAASATSISIQYDKNSDGDCADADEAITFDYDNVGLNVRRNTTQILTDGNATAFDLAYYPQQTASSAPAPYCVSPGVPSGCSGTLSGNFKLVQKVVLTLTITPKSNDSDFKGTPVTVSLTADLRNHGF
jgi:prepilin-type N-terminal cleavage/methylation domain-containing protein